MKLRDNQITLLNTMKAEMDKLIRNNRFLDAKIFIDGLYVSIAYMDSVNTMTKEEEEDEMWGDIKPQLTAEEQAEEDEMWGDIKPSPEFKKALPKKISEQFTPLLPLLGDKPSVINLDTMRAFKNNVDLILNSA